MEGEGGREEVKEGQVGEKEAKAEAERGKAGKVKEEEETEGREGGRGEETEKAGAREAGTGLAKEEKAKAKEDWEAQVEAGEEVDGWEALEVPEVQVGMIILLDGSFYLKLSE